MIDPRTVNLAASRVSERQFVKRLLQFRMRVLIGLVIADFIMLLIGGIGTDSVTARRQKIDDDIARVQNQSLGTRERLASLKDTQQLSAWNRKLAGQSFLWLQAVTSLTKSLPKHIWLSSVKTNPKDGTVQVEGTSSDLSTLAELSVNLSEQNGFKDIKLGSSEMQVIDGTPAVRFNLSFRISGVKSADEKQAQSSDGGGS